MALFCEDLANRLLATVHRVFQKWLEIMLAKLRFLIAWPEREITRQNITCSLRCYIEIFIDTPSSYAARSKTYLDYKKHNTVKFPILRVGPFAFSLGVVCQIRTSHNIAIV